MSNKIYDAFDAIKAEEKLKTDTLRFLEERLASEAAQSNKLQRSRSRRRRITSLRLGLAAAAVVLVLAVGIVSYSTYFTKAFYLDIDVNPSIELTVNAYNRVIGVYAYNEEGREVLEAASVENMTSEEAVASLIDAMVAQGYVEDAELFSATLQEAEEQDAGNRLATLQELITSLLAVKGLSLEQEVYLVDADTKAHAHGENMTPAKYLAILELMEVDATASFDSCRHNSLSAIRQQTHQHRYGAGGSAAEGAGRHGSATAEATHNAYGADTGSGQDFSGSGHSSTGTESEHHSSGSDASHGQGNANSGRNH